jgi:hypothetical protein
MLSQIANVRMSDPLSPSPPASSITITQHCERSDQGTADRFEARDASLHAPECARAVLDSNSDASHECV